MGPALLAAAALLLPVRSLQQLAYVASIAIAILVVWSWGRLAARALLDVPDVGPVTAVFLGQWALLAFVVVATSVNAAAAALLGVALPLWPLVLAPSIPLVVVELRRVRAGRRHREQTVAASPLALLALGSLAVVTAIYSRHLSALGLDTHEHLAWVRQVLNGGFVPLVEPTTAILADYPRTFHLLTATWSAAGLALPPGPFVKVMPFLQAWLTAAAVAELLARVAARTSRSRLAWEVVLGAACWLYAFLLVPTARIVQDLSGTPRYSSTGILLLPVTLIILAVAHDSAAAARVAFTVLPLVGAWALTMNPVGLVLVFTAVLPVLGVTWVALRRERPPSGRWRRAEFAVPVLLAVLVLACDAWVVSQLADRSRAVAGLLRRQGVVTYAEAVRTGMASDHDKSFRPDIAQPACRAVGCATRIAWDVSRDLARASVEGLRDGGREVASLVRHPTIKGTEVALAGSLPIQPSNFFPHAALPFALIVLAGLGRALWRLTRTGAAPLGLAPRLLLWWTIGVLLTGFAIRFTGAMAAALRDGTHEAALLARYLLSSGQPIAVGWFWVEFLLAAIVLLEPAAPTAQGEPTDAAAAGRRHGWLVRAGAVAASLVLPSVATLNLDVAWRNRAFMTKIGLGDLRALREIERAIPPLDGVIVPAEHSNIGDWEHWVIPVGETAALLPYGNRRYLFNVYLGASYPRSWHDLEERLCGPSRADRTRFLQENRAPWLLLRDPAARSPDEAIASARICEKPVADLFPDLRAVRTERGLYLFRIPDVVTPGSAPAASR